MVSGQKQGASITSLDDIQIRMWSHFKIASQEGSKVLRLNLWARQNECDDITSMIVLPWTWGAVIESVFSQYSIGRNVFHLLELTAPALCRFYPRIIEIYPLLVIALPFRYKYSGPLPHSTTQQLSSDCDDTDLLYLTERRRESPKNTGGSFDRASRRPQLGPFIPSRSFARCPDFLFSAIIRRNHNQTGWPKRHSVMLILKYNQPWTKTANYTKSRMPCTLCTI